MWLCRMTDEFSVNINGNADCLLDKTGGWSTFQILTFIHSILSSLLLKYEKYGSFFFILEINNSTLRQADFG